MVRSVKAGAVVLGRCFCRYCRQLRHSINHAVFNCQALVFQLFTHNYTSVGIVLCQH